jgi:rhodanese-related sulfurtransferase
MTGTATAQHQQLSQPQNSRQSIGSNQPKKASKMTAITPVQSLVAAAKSETNTVSPQQAFDNQQAGIAVLIDIRDIRELQREGQIDGAFHAPRGMLEFWADPQSPYHKEIFTQSHDLVLFCASSWRSALAAKTLQDMGMTNIYDMDGGFAAWKGAGLAFTDRPQSK